MNLTASGEDVLALLRLVEFYAWVSARHLLEASDQFSGLGKHLRLNRNLDEALRESIEFGEVGTFHGARYRSSLEEYIFEASDTHDTSWTDLVDGFKALSTH